MKRRLCLLLGVFLCNYTLAMKSTKKPKKFEKQIAKIIAQKEYAQRYFAELRLEETEQLDILKEVSNKLPAPLHKKSYRALCKSHTLIDAALCATVKKLSEHHSGVTGNTLNTISSTGMCNTIPGNMKEYLCKKAIASLRGWDLFTMRHDDCDNNGVMCISERCDQVALETKTHQLILVDLKTNTSKVVTSLSKASHNFGQFSQDGFRLVVAHGSQDVLVYDSAGTLMQTITYPMVINRVLFTENNGLLACKDENNSYVSYCLSDGTYGSLMKLPMGLQAYSSTKKTKHYELSSWFGTTYINKKPTVSCLLCQMALDNSGDIAALSNIKNSTVFNRLNQVEKEHFTKEIENKINSLMQPSSTSLGMLGWMSVFCSTGDYELIKDKTE